MPFSHEIHSFDAQAGGELSQDPWFYYFNKKYLEKGRKKKFRN